MANEGRARPRDAAGSGEAEDVGMTPRALVLIVAFWTLFATFQASYWLFDYRVRYPGPVLAIAFANAYMWALLTPAIFRLASHVNPEHSAGLWGVVCVAAIGLVVATTMAGGASIIDRALLPPPGGMGPAPARGLPTLRGIRREVGRRYLQEAVTFGVVLVAGLMLDIARRARARERVAAQLQAEQAELRTRAARLQAQGAELQAQLAEARLAVLRTRLNPHFLFNTLNAVSALVATDPRGVRDMIALLSELLRYALSDANAREIPLRDELALLRVYLEILEIRYQGQLRTVVSAEGEAQDALVPNLILQPLVENAVKHAIDRAGGHGTIEVRARRAGDDLVLTVRDTGPGDDAASPHGAGGIGLRLTRDRLSEHYGDEHRLELEPVPNGGSKAGTIARVTLPYHTGDEVRVAAASAAT